MTDSEVVVRITTQHPQWPLHRQTPGHSLRWGRYRFVVNEPIERCDHWVVCEGLLNTERAHCPPQNVALVTWEPPGGIRPPYAKRFLRQFATVLTCHRSIDHAGVRYGQQGHPWFVDRDYDELQVTPPPSTGPVLSMVTSDKAITPLQRQRVAFARLLADHFGDDIVVVGRGFEEVADKWDVLVSSRYSVVVENAICDDWLTEKLPDALLAGSVPFYCGAPNVSSYIDPHAIELIDVRRPTDALRRIEAVLSDPTHHERALPYVELSRRRYLDELQLFPMVARLLDARSTDARAEEVVLEPEPLPSLLWRARRKLSLTR